MTVSRWNIDGRGGSEAAVGFDLLGTRVGISSDSGTALESLIGVAPPAATLCPYGSTVERLFVDTGSAGSGGGLYFESRGNEELLRFDRLGPAELKAVESKLQLVFALAAAPDTLFLHAGAVAFGQRGILIAGNTYSGKTTLIAELVSRGAGYFTDDCAVITAGGLLFPNPSRLGIRTSRFEREPRSAAELGSADATLPVPVTDIYFTSFEAGAVFEPQRLTDGAAALEVLGSFFYPAVVDHYPAECIRFASSLAAKARVYAGTRAEAADAADVIERRARQ